MGGYALPIFAGLLLLVAGHAWYWRSAAAVRWTCALLALTLLGILLSLAYRIGAKVTGQPPHFQATERTPSWMVLVYPTLEVVVVAIAILFYRFAVTKGLSLLSIVEKRSPKQQLWSIKMSLGLFAFVMFSAGGQLALQFQHVSGPHRVDRPEFSELAGGFGPFLIGYATYRIGGWIAARRLGVVKTPSASRLTADGTR